MDWHLPENIEAIGTKARVCFNCSHVMCWTQLPGFWVGRCMEECAADFGQYIWLERDTCGYFCRRAEEGSE